MENGNSLIKSFVSAEGRFLVITILVITFFLFGLVPTVQAKINDDQVKEIKTVLEIANFPALSDLTDARLKEILNKLIKTEEPDVTYGILILGAFDEVEFMDMVLSQGYKTKGMAYFNQILDERIDLFNHWKGVGKNFYSVFKKGSSATPVTLLAMESIEIINKTMDIFNAFEVLRDMKKYDGLWYYFDLRKNGNESHEVAWGEAKLLMNWAVKETDRFKGAGGSKMVQLEQQFLALWEKWGPYATPYGISREYKEQLAGELRNTLAVALESHHFAAEEPSLWEKLARQLENIKNALAALVSQINPFKAGPIIELSEPLTEVAPPYDVPVPAPVPAPTPELPPPAPELEPIPLLPPVPEELVQAKPSQIEEATSTEPAPTPALQPAPVLPAEENETSSDLVSLCQKKAGDLARRYRVLINEVAWMGTENSSNDEWIVVIK